MDAARAAEQMRRQFATYSQLLELPVFQDWLRGEGWAPVVEPPPLPSCLDAEQAALGAMLMDATATATGLRELTPLSLSRDRHRRIWRAMDALHREGTPVDMVTVVERLRETGELDGIGGGAYIADLLTTCPTSANMGAYIKPIVRAARQRTLAELGERLQAAALAPGAQPDYLVSRLRQAADAIEQRGAVRLHKCFEEQK